MEKPKMGRRGVILSRRDNCKYMKDVYADVIDKIFDEQSENEILNGVVEKTLDLYTKTNWNLRHVKKMKTIYRI